jgi:hypothetical protein
MKRKVLVTERTWPHGYSRPPVIKEVGIGDFHCWGNGYEEFESGPGNYTTAIVEMSDGTILTPLPTDIKFLIPKEFDLNKDLLDACIKANQYLAYLASEGKLNDQNEVDNWSEVQFLLHETIEKVNGGSE